MVGIEQKARAGAREAPKRTAHQRGQDARDHLARRSAVQAVAPCATGVAAELVGALGHINVRYIGHRHRSPCAFNLLDTLFAHSTPRNSLETIRLTLPRRRHQLEACPLIGRTIPQASFHSSILQRLCIMRQPNRGSRLF